MTLVKVFRLKKKDQRRNKLFFPQPVATSVTAEILMWAWFGY